MARGKGGEKASQVKKEQDLNFQALAQAEEAQWDSDGDDDSSDYSQASEANLAPSDRNNHNDSEDECQHSCKAL